MKVNYFKKITSKNGLFFSLVTVLVIGIIYGTLLIKIKPDSFDKLSFLVTNYDINNSNQTLFSFFVASFFNQFLFLITVYLLGYSGVGQIFCYCVVAFKGLGIGGYIAHLYSMNFKGNIIYFLVVIMLPTALSIFILIIASKEAIKLSNIIFKTLFSIRENIINISMIKLYQYKYLILLLLTGVSSVFYVIGALVYNKIIK